MDLQLFLNQYDAPGSVILLEGKRKVKAEDKQILINFGKKLAESSKNIVFRSGNASGADEYFSEGVASINPERLQVVMPYLSHRQKARLTNNIISLDQVDLHKETNLVQLSKKNKSISTLINKYLAGHRNNFTHKAAYILRDTLKVAGAAGINPTSFAIFYDDLQKPRSGGTGHTMMMCDNLEIEYHTQNTWFSWL